MNEKVVNRLIVAIALISYICILASYCILDYQYQRKVLLDSIDAELYKSAASLKFMLPDDLHDRAVDAHSLSLEEDQYLARKLTRFVKETGFKYAYTVINKEGRLYFILADLIADPGTKRGTFYYYRYDDADESFFSAFQSSRPTYSTVTDQWGPVRTVMVPETSPGGVKYLACVDYDISHVKEMLNRNWLRSSAIILFFLFLSLPIVMIYSRLHRSYLTSLKVSEERYRSIFENSVEGFFQSTPEGRFISVNPAFSRMFGYNSPDELITQISDISSQYYLNTKDRDHFRKILDRDGLVEKFEFKAKRKDGSEVWISNSTRAIRNIKGEIIRYEGNVEDISERKRAESELMRLNQLQQTIIDNASIWLHVMDPQGNILVWNNAAESISGYQKEEVISHDRVWEWCYPDPEYRSQLKAKLPPILEKNEIMKDFETTICCKDNDERQISWYSRKLADEHGSVIGVIVLGRDVTDFNRTKEALRKSEEQLARSKKMESLGLLAGGVAHDLNNVLSGIVSYPELILLDLPEDSKYRKPIETIQDSGKRAAAIVEDLLTIARGVAITRQTLNLNDLIGSYLKSPEYNKLKMFHPSVIVESHLENSLFNISGSAVHINKVVMNLVSNAAEAIEDNGTVILSTRNCYLDTPVSGYEDVAVGEYVVLSVGDDGQGITDDDLERIFEPFYSKKSMGRSGTGLGLAVVWNIVQDHRGFIDIHTGKKGTTFELFFPISREKITEEYSTLSIKEMKAKGESILIVDDVESQREISAKMLESLGYECKTAACGEDAIEFLQTNKVDLIVLDMIMDPGMSGRQTFEKIIQIHPGQKAVIVSGFAETEDVQKTQEMGAGQYLKKPLSLKKLGQALRQELER